MLMPFWDDLTGLSGIFGTAVPAYYSTTGAVGSRIFTFEWKDWGRYSTTKTANFQVKLYEGSNIIDFCYGTSNFNTSGLTSGSIGIANSGTDFQSLPNTGTAPVPSSTIFTETLSSSPANGQVYRWSTCNSGTITGTRTVCVGSTTNLSDVITGGTWTSSSTGIATVSATGVVGGVSGGTSTITYTSSVGCYTVAVVTVNPLPGTINGTRSVCTGATTTLTDASAGTWSSGTPTVATVIAGTGVVTGVAPGTSNITFTTAAGCTAIAVVTVNPGASPITGTLSVCVGLNTALTDAGGGTWTASGTAVVGSSGVVSGLSTGTAIITYTLPGGCFVTATVTVNPSPTTILGASTVCEGSTITLSDAVAGGTWSSSATGTATVISGTGVVTGVSAAGTGITTITYDLGAGCSITKQITVNVTPAAITGTLSVCVGAVTSLTDATAGGTWSSAIPTVGTVDASGNVTGIALGTTVISYSLGSCYAIAVVTVNTAPGPITGTLSVCETFTTTLTDSPTGGVWASTPSTVATVTGGVVTGVSAGTAAISYQIGTCYATTVVTVNTQPAAITGITSVCAGSSTALTDATAGGTWSSTVVAVGTVSGTGNVTGIGVGTTTISYTIGTCVATTIVTVNTQPGAILGTLTVCETFTTSLSDATTGGVWSSTPATTASISGSGLVTGVAAGTATISYTIGSCYATAIVTVNTQPGAITGLTSVCVGSSTALTDAVAGGTWTSSNTAAGTVSATGVVTGVGVGTTTISYTIGTCATSIVVTVNTQPVAITGNTGPICNTTTLALSDATTGGVWSSAPTTVATISAGGLVTGAGVGTATISYSIGTCAVSTVVTVNLQPSAISGSPSVCSGFTTQLSDVDAGGTWSSTVLAVGTVDATGLVNGLSVGTTTISYTIGSCAATAVVTVNSTPVAITGTLSVCETFTTQLSDATGGGVWSSTPATTATISGTGLVTGVAAGTATISYSISGCAATAIVTVNTQPAAITGALGVCNSFTTQLSDATAGGTWTSVTTTVATIDATGLVTGVGLGTSVISYTLGSCAATATVTVNSQPVAITGTLTVCATFTTQLSDATSGGVWSSTPATTASISGTGLVTGVAAGTATISYDISGCAVTAIVTVNTQPAAITGSLAVCQGLTTQLSDATTGGVWTSGTTGVATIDAAGLVTGLATGTSLISYTLGTCAATAVVTVQPLPVAISGTKTVCVGSTTSLSDATGGGTWSASNGNATVSGTGLVTGVTAGTDVITYTIGTGCIVTTIVTINPLPSAISGATSVCLGFTVTLSDATAGGTWSSGNATIASVTAGGVVTGNAVGVTSISYTLGTGCRVTSPMTVNPLPGTINGPVTVCPGSSVTLTNASAPGTWSSSNGAVATIVAGTGVLTGIIAGTSNITFTLGTGCYVTRVETVNPAPAATITPLGDTTFCPGGFVVLTANVASGLTYQWYQNGGAIAGATASTYTAVLTGSFTVTETNTFGCSANSIPMLVTVDNPVAVIALASGSTTICAGSTTTINATTGVGYTYQWLLAGVPITGETNSTLAVSTAGDYAVIVTNATGCSATSNTITIAISPAPTAGVVLSGPITFCAGGSVTLTADLSAGYTYQWYNAAGAISGEVGNTYTATTTGGYYVIVSNGFGCATTSVITNVVADPLPDVTITPAGPTLFCAGGSVVLNAVSVAGDIYQWYKDGVAITGATSASYLATASGSYTVKVINPTTGCSAETPAGAGTVVTVITSPSIVPLTPTNYCWGSSAILSTSVSGTGVTYQWYKDGVLIPGATGATYNVTTPGDYTVDITITGSCTNTTSSVHVNEFPLPNPIVSYSSTSHVFYTGNFYVTYQWYKDGSPIAGATSYGVADIGNGNYKVRVTDTNGCQSVSDPYPFTGSTTGVHNVNKTDVSIYPNPAQSVLHIEAGITVRAVITSVDGRSILDIAEAKDINISNLADGVYMIAVYDNNGQKLKTEKLVKATN